MWLLKSSPSRDDRENGKEKEKNGRYMFGKNNKYKENWGL